jgi:carbon monoxide dehydrogenase subunit G
MEFTNQFHVPLPLAEAWKLMLDVPRILPCLPGARLIEIMSDHRYKGSVTVKLGPVKLAFDGQAQLVRVDEQAHRAWLKGSGMDAKGRGGAQSEFGFTLQAAGSGTDVTVHTQLQLTGAIAQYGRGSGMISEVATQLLAQFEHNLSEMLIDERLDATLSVVTAAALPAVPPATMAVGGAPGSISAASGQASSHELQTLHQQSQALLAQSQAVLATTQQTLAEVRAMAKMARSSGRAKELNGFSLLWRALWSRVSGRGGSDSSPPKA